MNLNRHETVVSCFECNIPIIPQDTDWVEDSDVKSAGCPWCCWAQCSMIHNAAGSEQSEPRNLDGGKEPTILCA